MTTVANVPAPASGMLSDLQAGIVGDAKLVLIGLNWTLVQGPHGIGLAHTPVRGTAGCRTSPAPGDYAGTALADLAALAGANNIFERAIGFAALSAHHNRADLPGAESNGLDLLDGTGRKTVVIGRFPRLNERFPEAVVIEREPGPGDHPESAAPELLAQAEQVLMTGSTLTNGSLTGLLPLIPSAAFVVLVGPSTPLAPILFDHGINALSGLVALDEDAIIRCISEGAAVSAIRPYSRFLTLQRD